MKFITLGTSHGDATYCRFNSSTLYECADGSLYLFDAGAPVDALMTRCGKAFSKLKAVFNTHVHTDHIGGLPILIKAYLKYFSPAVPLFVSTAEDIEAPLKAFYAAMHAQKAAEMDKYVQFAVTTAGAVYEDDNIAVCAIPTRHMEYCGGKSYAYALTDKSEGKTLLYTGDLDAKFSDFPAAVAADVCVCEATHYKPEYAAEVLPKCQFGNFVFNHIHDPWHGEEGEARLLSYCRDLPYPVQIAHDMQIFEF